MRTHIIGYIASALATGMLLTGCSEENPVTPRDDHDVVTTITLSCVSTTGDTLSFTWQDDDAQGSAPPSRIDTIRLPAHAHFTGNVHVYNSTVNPVADITPSILADANHHQFMFTDSRKLVEFSATDTDANGKPIGLKYSLMTGENGSSTLRVSLYHYENATDKVDNVPGSESDISVEFPLLIE